jgi:dolichol-phosphate mannosyltransferase
MSVTYSVVVPIKDEASNIPDLVKELELVMENPDHSWELIFVDDGSTDESLKILTELSQSRPFLKILVFTQNFGQSSAFDAGFKYASGEFIITLDGDRQNDPADIPKLIAQLKDCDLVCGWRVNRKDSLTKKITSTIANTVRRYVCRDNVHDTGCSLKIYRKSCLEQIKMYNGMHRFLPALFSIEGFRVKEVPVNHRERPSGISKYNFLNRALAPITDMLAILWMRRRALHYSVKKEIP